jgi:hypothetical protein
MNTLIVSILIVVGCIVYFPLAAQIIVWTIDGLNHLANEEER